MNVSNVIPAKAGIQHERRNPLDTGFRRCDGGSPSHFWRFFL